DTPAPGSRARRAALQKRTHPSHQKTPGSCPPACETSGKSQTPNAQTPKKYQITNNRSQNEPSPRAHALEIDVRQRQPLRDLCALRVNPIRKPEGPSS